ncbi:hypothetical protein CBS147346_5306 [Aspergillus niger]|nr:hypothetical protein CBS147346_5306 [Aspergillus niger]
MEGSGQRDAMHQLQLSSQVCDRCRIVAIVERLKLHVSHPSNLKGERGPEDTLSNKKGCSMSSEHKMRIYSARSSNYVLVTPQI